MPTPPCAVEVGKLANGIEAVTLISPSIRVTVLANKGADIYSLVHCKSGVDVLWKSPLGLRAPTHGWFTADSQAAWLEMYEGGWQEIFPNGGDACPHATRVVRRAGLALSLHPAGRHAARRGECGIRRLDATAEGG